MNLLKLIRFNKGSFFNFSHFKMENVAFNRPMIAFTPRPTDESLQFGSSPKTGQKTGPIFGIAFSMVALGLVFKKLKEYQILPIAHCSIPGDGCPVKGGAAEETKVEVKVDEKGEKVEVKVEVEEKPGEKVEVKVEEKVEAKVEPCPCQDPLKPCGPYPPPPCCDETCIQKIECIEECIAKANADLEKCLKDIKAKAAAKTEEALKLLCSGQESAENYVTKGYEAIEADSAQAYCEVYKIASDRSGKVGKAIAASDVAWELLCRLRETLEAGKCCEYTHCNPLLITMEQFANCAERELVNARGSLDCIKACGVTVCKYCGIINNFKRELQSQVPAECDCDCSALMRVAYRKLLDIQREIALVKVCNANANKGPQVQMAISNLQSSNLQSSNLQLQKTATACDISN